MLYQFLHSQDTNVSNATTRSVMYLQQTAAESLQVIQVSQSIYSSSVLNYIMPYKMVVEILDYLIAKN